MCTPETRTVVIGVGNTTLRDDGVGVLVAREIARRLDGREDAEVIDLGAGGLRLMEAMAGYDRAIVLDALMTGVVAPGTTVELQLGDLVAARNLGCVHDMNLPVALEWGRAVGVSLPVEIRLFGIEAADVATYGETLTPPVAAAVPELAARVLSLISRAQRGEVAR